MSNLYDDSKFGVTKIMTLASVTVTNSGTVVRFIAPTDMYITEMGLMVSTALSGCNTTITFSGSTSATLASVACTSVAATAAVGTLFTSAACTSTATSGALLCVVLASAGNAGAVTPYIKYRSTY